MNYNQISHDKTIEFCKEVFSTYGFNEKEAAEITDVLLCADLFGIESHGIQRLIRYHSEIGVGFVDVNAKPEIVHQTGVSAVIDAHKAMGQIVSIEAMNLAIEKAKNTGIGIVTVRNSNHYGIAGYYTRMAADADLMGICMTNTEAICVPTFGKQAMLGTNPIALSMPADPLNFTFDAATTVVPRGKLEVYHKNGKELPASWTVDEFGKPTQDSGRVLKNIINKIGGGISPLGGSGEDNSGHKGYGLALIVDLFSGIFSGGMTSNHINVKPGQVDICHFFAAIDYNIFGDKKTIKDNFSKFLQELRDSNKADGEDRIFIHGEKEAESKASKKSATIPVNDKTWQEMQDIAKERGVEFSKYYN